MGGAPAGGGGLVLVPMQGQGGQAISQLSRTSHAVPSSEPTLCCRQAPLREQPLHRCLPAARAAHSTGTGGRAWTRASRVAACSAAAAGPRHPVACCSRACRTPWAWGWVGWGLGCVVGVVGLRGRETAWVGSLGRQVAAAALQCTSGGRPHAAEPVTRCTVAQLRSVAGPTWLLPALPGRAAARRSWQRPPARGPGA